MRSSSGNSESNRRDGRPTILRVSEMISALSYTLDLTGEETKWDPARDTGKIFRLYNV
jgi:hypothetical protein